MGLRSNLQLPKEHGSWGMFFIPVILGLVVGGRWHADTILFLLAGVAAFLAREPFMVAWRGWRRGAEAGKAPRMTLVYGLTAAVCGIPLLPSYPWLVLLGAAGAVLYAWHAEASMRGEGRSLGTELIAIATSMLGAPAAFYVSTGRLDRTALVLWLTTFGYFAGTVLYVKMRLTDARVRDAEVRRRVRRNSVIYHVSLALAVLVLPVVVIAGYVPAIARALWYAARPTAVVSLKQIGWTEVVYSLVFLFTAAAGLRE